MAGIYVHIPFCKSRCIYCDFYSTTDLAIRQRYIDAVCKEMSMRRDYIRGAFSTVYIGGGTPSQLEHKQIEKLFDCIYKVFDVEEGAEVTMECNPDDITPDFASLLSRLPVNRVSMGAQTFSDLRLKQLRRRHNAAETIRAVSLLRSAGIGNISIDLMFGFSDETAEEWSNDIRQALSFDVEHISAYSLMYEEGTPLTKMLQSGKIHEIDEETSRRMYDMLVSALTGAGYEHYEISNFARPGMRSRHNSSYWRHVAYIGLGAAAHSFDLDSRQWNVADISKYIAGAAKGDIPHKREALDDTTTFNDLITTALRTSDGISMSLVSARLGKRFHDALTDSSRKYVSSGLMELKGDRLRLTADGIFVSDMIMSDLMIV